MIEPDHPQLSVARSSFCYMSKGETEQNLDLMRQIDEQFLETPFFGGQQMTWLPHNDGHPGNEKRTPDDAYFDAIQMNQAA
jgi:putative transposase